LPILKVINGIKSVGEARAVAIALFAISIIALRFLAQAVILSLSPPVILGLLSFLM
jgi:hypothetical protein